MAKALGLGGIFFKANDPDALADWYRLWLGIKLGPGFCGSCFYPAELPEKAYSVWSPFEESTKYFEPSENRFMVNLIVDELGAALAQVSEGGAEVVGEVEENEYGRFGWFIDPEGNKVELWQLPG